MDTQSITVTNQTLDDSRNKVEAPVKETYRKLIMEALSAHADVPEDNLQIKIVTVFDTHSDRYQLLRTGWNGSKHIFNPILHIDIIEDKVWIQINKTDIEIGEELAFVGIPKSNIVLGLMPPHLRAYNPEYCIL
jgi:muramidase (phage lysozyme)